VDAEAGSPGAVVRGWSGGPGQSAVCVVAVEMLLLASIKRDHDRRLRDAPRHTRHARLTSVVTRNGIGSTPAATSQIPAVRLDG